METKSQVHSYCIRICAKWVWALYHPPDKSEVYYLQGCHAGTFSKYKIRKPNNVKKYNSLLYHKHTVVSHT